MGGLGTGQLPVHGLGGLWLARGLAQTVKLNGLDPKASLREVLSSIAEHPIIRINELLSCKLMQSGDTTAPGSMGAPGVDQRALDHM